MGGSGQKKTCVQVSEGRGDGATCEALKNMYMCGEPGVGSWEKLFCPGQIPFLTGLLSLSPTAVFLCDASHLLLPRSNAAFSKKLSP